jgi:Tol biopolymer transport system component
LPTLAEIFEQNPGRDGFGGPTAYDWSPDSDAIVAGVDVSFCAPVGELQPVLAGLYILKLDGSPEEKLTDQAAAAVAWSPFGRYIAYVAAQSFAEAMSGAGPLRLLDLTTREVTDLAQGSQPAWQPQP